MTRKYVLVEEAAAEFHKDPNGAGDPGMADKEISALAAAMAQARGLANMTQEEVARKMGTNQAQIARLECGSSMPSTRTLQRFARATGMQLRISFQRPIP